MKPLQYIKVLEMEGLAPTVLAGRILSDFGAYVTIVSRQEKTSLSMDTHETILNHGKQSITIDLKSTQDIKILKEMIKDYNVIIDAFKPGVMEKLGIGPNECFKINPKLVYARISSFGQNSQISHKAGHDINFISYSGALSMLASTGNNPHNEQPPAFPANILGDFAAGSCLGVIGILVALQHVQNGGNGQVVDLGMAQASLYLSQFIINSKIHQIWNQPRGHNLLDGGAHFYNVYKCKDNKFISLGCIEPKFYEKFVEILSTQNDVVSKEFCDELLDNHLNIDKWIEFKGRLQQLFETKTRQEWTDIFKESESCFSPVYEANEIKQVGNKLLSQKDRSFLIDLDKTDPYNFLVSPQPILSQMPKQFQYINLPRRGEHNEIKPKL